MASVPNTRLAKQPCRYHMQGKCTRGKACPFAHPDRKEEARNSTMATVLRLVFEKQADALLQSDGTVLNLQRLSACPDLAKLASSVDFDSMAFCEALVGVISTHAPEMRFLNVDDNGVRSLFHLLKALERAGLHISLRGLSAANNRINTFEFIKQLKPFDALIEIRLLGNPIAEKPEYRATIRKGMPSLEGLDGEGIHRPPLNLPWPQATVHADATVAMLQQVEARLFRALEGGGSIDALSSLYADDALFSLLCDEAACVKAPALSADLQRRNVVLRDFVSMRMAQTDRHNDLKTARSVKTARGRTDVCAALRATLYPRTMTCVHELSPQSDAVAIAEGVKVPLQLFTFHGTISWFHKDAPPDVAPVTRIFDRSLAVATGDGAFQIVSDMVTLRPHEGDPVWFANSEARIDRLAATYELPAEVMRSIVGVSATDIDIGEASRELKLLPPDALAACIAVTAGDDGQAVVVARLMARTSAPPDVAFAALQQCGFDLAAAQATLQ